MRSTECLQFQRGCLGGEAKGAYEGERIRVMSTLIAVFPTFGHGPDRSPCRKGPWIYSDEHILMSVSQGSLSGDTAMASGNGRKGTEGC